MGPLQNACGQSNVLITRFATTLELVKLETDVLHFAAWMRFESIKRIALFTKHQGFREEREWRLAYVKALDVDDALVNMLDFNVGPRGVEQKLKFKIGRIAGVTADDLSLSKLIDCILSGPTISPPIARMAVGRMLQRLSPGLENRLRASTIPFRSQ